MHFDNTPIKGHIKLLKGWIEIAGQTHCEGCSVARVQMVRLAKSKLL